MVLVRSLLPHKSVPPEIELPSSKRKRIIHRLCARSASHFLPSALRRHFTHHHPPFHLYFILRSAKCSPRVFDGEPTAEHAQRDCIQQRLGALGLSYRFHHPRKTDAT